MGDVQRRVMLLTALSLLACQRSDDRVLQPDAPEPGSEMMPSSSTARVGAAGTGGSAGRAGSAGRVGAAGRTGAAGADAGEGQDAAVEEPPDAAAQSGAEASTPSGADAGEPAPEVPAAGSGGAAGHDGEGGTPTITQDPDCDFNGIWIGKQVTVSQALSLPQSSNNWYYLEFTQAGTAVQVSKHFDCGIEVLGSATVTLSRETTTALIDHNHQTGRKATLTKDGSTCTFDASRFWSVRGADEQRYLPNPARDSEDSLTAIAAANPLPKPDNTDGALDTEGDGKLGVAFQVTGVVSGTRNSVQRDWTRWFTEPGFEIAPSTDWPDELVVRADFDNEESVLDPTEGLLISGSLPAPDAKHVLKLRFLGRDASDPRVGALVKGTDLETCFAIQDAMPAEEL